METDRIHEVLFDREVGRFVPLRTGAIRGPISNSFILRYSPLEKIAEMLDFEFPSFVSDLFNVLENQNKKDLSEKYSLELVDGIDHKHLIEYFWVIAEKGNIMDLMFFHDYRLYINFFLQYSVVTGKELNKKLSFSEILKEYRQMEMPGSVAQITRENEYYFVWSGDLPEELATLDEVIARYKAENN